MGLDVSDGEHAENQAENQAFGRALPPPWKQGLDDVDVMDTRDGALWSHLNFYVHGCGVCGGTWARGQVEGLGYLQSTLQVLPPALVHREQSSPLEVREKSSGMTIRDHGHP